MLAEELIFPIPNWVGDAVDEYAVLWASRTSNLKDGEVRAVPIPTLPSEAKVTLSFEAWVKTMLDLWLLIYKNSLAFEYIPIWYCAALSEALTR